MTELWYVLLREPVESPALEIFKLHLDTILCNMFWVTLLGRGLGPDGPIQPHPTCDPVFYQGSSTSFPR